VTLNRKQKSNTLNESHDYVSKAKDRYNSNRNNNINDNQENIRKKSSENEYVNNDEFKN